MGVCHLHAKPTSHRVHTLVQVKNSRTFNVLYMCIRVMREYLQGCWVRAARSPEVPTICQPATKLLNKEPMKLMILMAIASTPTSNERTTKFPPTSVLLKRKRKMCGNRL